MKNRFSLLVAQAFMLSVICIYPGGAAEQGYAVKQLMQTSVVPASDVVFWVATEAPVDADGWAIIEKNAKALAESSKQLLDHPPANNDVWLKEAGELETLASMAVDAAQRRDADKFADIGNSIYETCVICHQAYPTLNISK